MEAALRSGLVDLIHFIHRRGWAPGTGGNFSQLVSRVPFALLVTPSGVDKGAVKADDLLTVNEHGRAISGQARPSAETLLHVGVIEATGAQVVLHTHSVCNTLASLTPSSNSPHQFQIAGFEMLKGLRGVTTHEHVERIPILANSQDIGKLRRELNAVLRAQPDAHAVLIAGHGLYTWGNDLAEAQRHLEVLEFLFEVVLHRV